MLLRYGKKIFHKFNTSQYQDFSGLLFHYFREPFFANDLQITFLISVELHQTTFLKSMAPLREWIFLCQTFYKTESDRCL